MQLISIVKCGEYSLNLYQMDTIYTYVVKRGRNTVRLEQGVFDYLDDVFEWYNAFVDDDKARYERDGCI